MKKLRQLSEESFLTLFFFVFSSAFLIAAFCMPDRDQMLAGFWRILNQPTLSSTNAFSIGGFSACYAPFELFAELGIQIKDGSPFDATFVCCYSNYIFSYMPTQLAFDHGGYGAYKCNFEPGTGEIIADTFISQLNTLHQSN